MNYTQLFNLIKRKKSFLCVGLDSDIEKIPSFLKKFDDPVFEFNKSIIDATIDFTVAYKPNLAFYESRGVKGLESLQKTIDYLNSFGDNIFTIADAKRGDIGNTSKQYAKAFFEVFNFDAITIAPYMGKDSVSPFLAFKDKWVVLLALTSNEGASDFQYFQNASSTKLFQEVLYKSQQWSTKENMMYVVGATKAEALSEIRKTIPDHFLLVPGIGVQGGRLEEVVRFGMNDKCGLLINSSRAIIFASSDEDFAKRAGEKTFELQKQMEILLSENKII